MIFRFLSAVGLSMCLGTAASAQSVETFVPDAWSEYTERRPNAANVKTMHPLGGSWRCNIDGRTGYMFWTTPVTVTEREWYGLTVVDSQFHPPLGQFLDTGWDGTNTNRANLSGLAITIWPPFTFQHEDGNTWMLDVTEFIETPTYGIYIATQVSGHTTWNGNQYPLSCSRIRNGLGPIY